MRVIAVVALAVMLAGCAKERIAAVSGSAPAMAAHGGPVCLMPGKPAADVEYTLLGKVAASYQWYGGYAKVHPGLARAARSWGGDAVIDLVSRQRFGFFAFAHPDAYGYAVKIHNPERFDCIASGGKIDPGTYVPTAQKAAPPRITQDGSTGYDECMARVMRISDPDLRLEAMAACDAAK